MSESPDGFSLRSRLVRFGHTTWAMLGLAGCGVLIFAGGEGHPPAIILLPVVLVVWALGTRGAMDRRLARRARRSERRTTEPTHSVVAARPASHPRRHRIHYRHRRVLIAPSPHARERRPRPRTDLGRHDGRLARPRHLLRKPALAPPVLCSLRGHTMLQAGRCSSAHKSPTTWFAACRSRRVSS